MAKNNFNTHSGLVDGLLQLSRFKKNLLIMITDYALLVFCFELSLCVRINAFYWPTPETRLLILLAPLLAIPIFYFCGLYQAFVRFTSYRSLLIIMNGLFLYTLIWFLIVLSSDLVIQPYDFLIINWLLTVFFIGGVRFLARWILTKKSSTHKNVVIYGAGNSGAQLVSAMKYNQEAHIIGFLDDDPNKKGLYIEDIKVYEPSFLKKLIETPGVDEVLIAMPSVSRSDLSNILKSLKQYQVVLRKLPDLSDLVSGKILVSDLKKVKIEDLLKREIRKPNEQLLKQDIEKKNILVTGAGGSIGSELCRQVIRQNPQLLILFDISEFALYSIERELLEINSDATIIPILGNVTKCSRLGKLIKKFKVHTIYHSAAYKHVPMVEKNTVAGIEANIFGTLSCIEAAIDGNVGSFVFISTDKAVRPTNTMGATKRFAELILQAIAKRQATRATHNETQISIVRFGNVLGSSGSVVPLFRQQIKEGGPVTVTDPNIVRYFMTIPEAAQLVIQAGAMGSEGDIFVLDMGEPIQVLELAKDMIKLSGMTVKDEKSPDGDIEIIFTGLRPGEKLYEELLISENVGATEHEKIMRATEGDLEWEDLQQYLAELEHASEIGDYKKIREIFLNTVSGYNPESEIADSIYLQQNNIIKES